MISGDTLSHGVKVTVCALCVALRLKITKILIMSYYLDVLGTQETSCILIVGLLERDIFNFDKPWVIHLRETCCCSTNLCTWRPNTIYKNRSVRRHQSPPCRGSVGGTLPSALIPSLAQNCDELSQIWSPSSRGVSREVFLSLALHRRSPREAPHEGLLRWASIFFLLLKAKAGLLKWPRSRWTGIPRNPVHRQGQKDSNQMTIDNRVRNTKFMHTRCHRQAQFNVCGLQQFFSVNTTYLEHCLPICHHLAPTSEHLWYCPPRSRPKFIPTWSGCQDFFVSVIVECT
jgi:hypothetical protein